MLMMMMMPTLLLFDINTFIVTVGCGGISSIIVIIIMNVDFMTVSNCSVCTVLVRNTVPGTVQ